MQAMFAMFQNTESQNSQPPPVSESVPASTAELAPTIAPAPVLTLAPSQAKTPATAIIVRKILVPIDTAHQGPTNQDQGEQGQERDK